MTTTIIIICVVLFVILVGSSSGNKDKKSAKKQSKDKVSVPLDIPKITLKLTDDDFFCKIAGASHHCDDDDIGGFIGYVKHDADNRYDKNAHGIYNLDGKLLGFIPKDELPDYVEFSKGGAAIA